MFRYNRQVVFSGRVVSHHQQALSHSVFAYDLQGAGQYAKAMAIKAFQMINPEDYKFR